MGLDLVGSAPALASEIGDTTAASGLIFILSGPSGVGKSTLIERLKEDGFPITYCVTATTRSRREGEVDGTHYHFLSRDQFQHLLDRDQLLEHAVVHGTNYYGIPLSSVREGLRKGDDIIMAPEVQGAATVRSKLPNAITIFLQPASMDELIPRLVARGTESSEERARRLQTAEREMLRVSEYDYVVVNQQGHLNNALEAVKAIISAERLKVHPRRVQV
jgi:guanylate kinase